MHYFTWKLELFSNILWVIAEVVNQLKRTEEQEHKLEKNKTFYEGYRNTVIKNWKLRIKMELIFVFLIQQNLLIPGKKMMMSAESPHPWAAPKRTILNRVKALEIKTSMPFNLDFANNTILSCFFFFFLIIDLYFLIPAAIPFL